MNERIHTQGGSIHLNEDEHAVATRTANRGERGLVPSGMILEGVWYEPPATSSSQGMKGMRAFDEDYMYLCVATNTWRRLPLLEWKV